MARTFNGTNQYLGITDPICTSANITISCAFRLIAMPVTTAYLVVLSKIGSAGARYMGIMISGSESGKPLYATQYAGVIQFGTQFAGTILTTGVWYRIVCEWLSNGNIKSYFLGTVYTTTGAGVVQPPGIDSMTIGAYRENGFVGLGVNADIAEVALWDTQLSTAEILGLNAGFSAKLIRPAINQSGDYFSLANENDPEFGIKKNRVLTHVNAPAHIHEHPLLIQ